MLSYEELLEEWRGRASEPLHDFLTLTDEGLLLGASTLLTTFQRNRGPSLQLDIDSQADRIIALLSVAYWYPIGLDILEHLRCASRAYAQGNKVLAHIHLAHTGLRKLENGDHEAQRLFIGDRLLAEGCSPIELLEGIGIGASVLELLKASPGDLKHPGWPAGAPNHQGGEFRPKDSNANASDLPALPVADFSGGFHGAVIDAWMAYFKEKGIPAIAAPAIRVVGPNNTVVGYPDIISVGPGPGWTVYEIKTGGDPPLTSNQAAYLPALQVGGHIYTDDPGIRELGLEPGVPFPPMVVIIVFAPGPGQPYIYHRLDPPTFEKPK